MKNSDGVLSRGMPRRSGRSMDFEKMIQDGEDRSATGGFCIQTANGSGHWRGTGWNKQADIPTMPEVPAGGAYQARRSNRTAE